MWCSRWKVLALGILLSSLAFSATSIWIPDVTCQQVLYGVAEPDRLVLAQLEWDYGDRIRDFQKRHRYQMIGPLHIGRERLVMLARHRDTGEIVSIKFGGDETAAESAHLEAIEVYCRENRIPSPLPPRVAYDSAAKALVVKAMESHDLTGTKHFVPARSLAELLTTRPALFGEAHPERVALIDRLLREQVKKLHAAGIVHRDLKPANVLVTQNEKGEVSVWIIDLGIARRRGDPNGPTIEGTPGYLSPNHRSGGRAEFSDDEFALDVISAQLRAGSPSP